MARFQRRTLESVEANQFLHPATAPAGVRTEEDSRAYVVTAHGQKVYLEAGDWVVAEPDGRGYYPIKDDIFRERFTLKKFDFDGPGCACQYKEGVVLRNMCGHHPDCPVYARWKACQF